MPPLRAAYIVVASSGKLSAPTVAVKPPMQQVTDWLEKLGLSEYAQHFADNDIDFSILGDLTDQHLKDVGVASLGHRLKILRAIAELDGQEATAAPRTAKKSKRSQNRRVRQSSPAGSNGGFVGCLPLSLRRLR